MSFPMSLLRSNFLKVFKQSEWSPLSLTHFRVSVQDFIRPPNSRLSFSTISKRSSITRYARPTTRLVVECQKVIYYTRRLESSKNLEEFPPAKIYKYEDIKQLSTNPKVDVILVDVREPIELEREGFIPTAINIPYKSSPHALSLSEEQFEEQFGFPKPSKEKELIFYCLGGVRSNFAQELAGSFGYQKRGDYSGSWEDWIEKEKLSK
ncbi:Rhodanese-like domain-containing protein [Dipodascopsis uninucleata]